MDENTMTEYGWIVIVLIVITVVFASVPVISNSVKEKAVAQISSHFENVEETTDSSAVTE